MTCHVHGGPYQDQGPGYGQRYRPSPLVTYSTTPVYETVQGGTLVHLTLLEPRSPLRRATRRSRDSNGTSSGRTSAALSPQGDTATCQSWLVPDRPRVWIEAIPDLGGRAEERRDNCHPLRLPSEPPRRTSATISSEDLKMFNLLLSGRHDHTCA